MLKRTFLSIVVAGLLFPVAPAAAQVVVIVNSANLAESLSADDVKAHFLKSPSRWDNGEKVRPVDRAGETAERDVFLSEVLGMSATEVERYWIQKQYASADTPPTKAPDDATVIRMVQSFRGGIGFVSRAAFEASDKSGIKAVLTIN